MLVITSTLPGRFGVRDAKMSGAFDASCLFVVSGRLRPSEIKLNYAQNTHSLRNVDNRCKSWSANGAMCWPWTTIQIKIKNEVIFSTPFGEKTTFLFSILLICDCGRSQSKVFSI